MLRQIEDSDPGQEAQIDYGTMYLLRGDSGRLKKVHILLVTLSHSRKAYAEAVLRQTTESLIRSLENAFLYFGGKQNGVRANSVAFLMELPKASRLLPNSAKAADSIRGGSLSRH